jgi:coenzyme F420-reducing hydrogenase beta subunit
MYKNSAKLEWMVINMSSFIKSKQSYDCCGCNACITACPSNCINYMNDSEGFLYPSVNNDCIDCGLCQKVCTYSSETKNDAPISAKCGYNKNSDIHIKSSSGGIFYAVAQKIVSEGGVVFATAMSEDFKSAQVIEVNNQKDLFKLLGSKYVQSNMGGCIEKITNELISGKKVFFCATPCQVAGVKSALKFTNTNTDNLLTCDFVCHGVVSPEIFSKYVSEKYKSKIISFSFRNKKFGWRYYSIYAQFQNGKKYRKIQQRDPYMRGFLTNISMRPSCHVCKYTSINRVSDITLADFWSVKGYNPSFYNKNGVSAVIINTKSGKKIIEDCESELYLKSCDIDFLVKATHCLHSPIKPSINRERFFEEYKKGKPLIPLLKKYAHPVSYLSIAIIEIKSVIKSILRVLGLRR